MIAIASAGNSDNGDHIDRCALPALRFAAVCNRAQLALEDATPHRDTGIGPSQRLSVAVRDASLARLNRDILNDCEVRMPDIGVRNPPRPDIFYDDANRRALRHASDKTPGAFRDSALRRRR